MKRRTRAAAAAGAGGAGTAAADATATAGTNGATANNNASASDPEQRERSGSVNANANDDLEPTQPSESAAGAPSTTDASASASVAPLTGPGTARVTRERALYFATGQRASPTTSAATATTARSRRGAARDDEQKESWPGYFSTARDLDENRLAAQAARQEELQRKEQEDATAARVVWTPRKKPRTTVLARENLVPSLQELALQCLAKHIELLPTLEYIDAAARAQVAKAVVKLRRMKSEGVHCV